MYTIVCTSSHFKVCMDENSNFFEVSSSYIIEFQCLFFLTFISSQQTHESPSAYSKVFKVFYLPALSDSQYITSPFSISMFEYDCLHRLNDLLSSGEVYQDWPFSMHYHASTPFNVSLSSWRRTALQAVCFIFTKHFTAYKITKNKFSCLLSILSEQRSDVSSASASSEGTTYLH